MFPSCLIPDSSAKLWDYLAITENRYLSRPKFKTILSNRMKLSNRVKLFTLA